MPKETYFDRAVRDGHAKFTGEGKAQRIVYLVVNYAERYSDSEEQVRAVLFGPEQFRERPACAYGKGL
jgi:hypothetical protein